MNPTIVLIIFGFIFGVIINFLKPREKLKSYLTKYLIYFGLPLFIFISLLGTPMEKFFGYGFTAFVLYILLNIILFFLIKSFSYPASKKASLLACTGFGNTGYIGLPFVYLFFQEAGVIIWTAATIFIGFVHYSLGIFLPNIYLGNKKFALTRIFKTPFIYILLLVVIISRFPITVPIFLKSFSLSVLFIAPLIIGLSLKFKQFDKTFIPGFILKFAVSPILFFLVLSFLGDFSWLEKGVFVLLALTPPPLIATLLAIEFKWDSAYAANFTSLGTVVFLITAFLIYFLFF